MQVKGVFRRPQVRQKQWMRDRDWGERCRWMWTDGKKINLKAIFFQKRILKNEDDSCFPSLQKSPQMQLLTYIKSNIENTKFKKYNLFIREPTNKTIPIIQ